LIRLICVISVLFYGHMSPLQALSEQQIDQHPLMIEAKRFLLEQTK